jgi:PIN domain nuclease of toxin-antitoxin system
MNLLLDIHAFLWFVGGSTSLGVTARQRIENYESHQSYLSIVSLWELAIKVSIGKLTLAKPFEQFVSDRLTSSGFKVLPIQLTHTYKIAALPFHHNDPFDRLLIAQSRVESMPLVSRDEKTPSMAMRLSVCGKGKFS